MSLKSRQSDFGIGIACRQNAAGKLADSTALLDSKQHGIISYSRQHGIIS